MSHMLHVYQILCFILTNESMYIWFVQISMSVRPTHVWMADSVQIRSMATSVLAYRATAVTAVRMVSFLFFLLLKTFVILFPFSCVLFHVVVYLVTTPMFPQL